jgi:hypothetical protein
MDGEKERDVSNGGVVLVGCRDGEGRPTLGWEKKGGTMVACVRNLGTTTQNYGRIILIGIYMSSFYVIILRLPSEVKDCVLEEE